jgi:hypothetical protein
MSASPTVSRRRRIEPAIVARSTPGSAARRFSMSRTSGRTSPSGRRPWCSRAKASPRRIFSSLFSPKRGSAPDALDRRQRGDVDRRPRPQLLVIRHHVGREQLGDLLGDALADAGDLRQRLHPALGEHVGARRVARRDRVRRFLI